MTGLPSLLHFPKATLHLQTIMFFSIPLTRSVSHLLPIVFLVLIMTSNVSVLAVLITSEMVLPKTPVGVMSLSNSIVITLLLEPKQHSQQGTTLSQRSCYSIG
jgi:hypothetical protein